MASCQPALLPCWLAAAGSPARGWGRRDEAPDYCPGPPGPPCLCVRSTRAFQGRWRGPWPLLVGPGRAVGQEGPGHCRGPHPGPRPTPSPAQPRPSANPGGVGSLWACTFPSVDCGHRVRFPSSHGGDPSMMEASEGCSRGFRARQPCAAPRGAAEPRPRATSQSPGRVPRSASACADSLPCSLQGGVSSVPETGLPLLLRTGESVSRGRTAWRRRLPGRRSHTPLTSLNKSATRSLHCSPAARSAFLAA